MPSRLRMSRCPPAASLESPRGALGRLRGGPCRGGDRAAALMCIVIRDKRPASERHSPNRLPEREVACCMDSSIGEIARQGHERP
jgi:hypothetical protein